VARIRARGTGSPSGPVTWPWTSAAGIVSGSGSEDAAGRPRGSLSASTGGATSPVSASDRGTAPGSGSS